MDYLTVKKKREEAGLANPFGYNPNQYNQTDGIFVTRKEEESHPSFLIDIKRLEGVFTEYVPGQNVFVRDKSSLVKQNWPVNSNDILEFRAKGKGRGRIY